jgi:hypothetical protein
MATRNGTRHQLVWRFGIIVIAGLLMTACNLGPAVPSEPTQEAPPTAGALGGDTLVATATPPIPVIPPTNTPPPALLPAETLGPITIDSGTHRTQETVTVRVRKGTSVSNVTCSWVHQDTGRTGALSELSETVIDITTVEKVYTFTPETAGTYSVSCTGVTVTASGQRAVSAAGTPFAVEAKG